MRRRCSRGARAPGLQRPGGFRPGPLARAAAAERPPRMRTTCLAALVVVCSAGGLRSQASAASVSFARGVTARRPSAARFVQHLSAECTGCGVLGGCGQPWWCLDGPLRSGVADCNHRCSRPVQLLASCSNQLAGLIPVALVREKKVGFIWCVSRSLDEASGEASSRASALMTGSRRRSKQPHGRGHGPRSSRLQCLSLA
jgi:hypothetical protein